MTSIANGITVEFADGNALPEVVVEYPIGHRRRRQESLPRLSEKFNRNLGRRFSEKRRERILAASLDSRLEGMSVCDYLDLYASPA